MAKKERGLNKDKSEANSLDALIFLRAVGNINRYQILACLKRGGKCVCDINTCLGLRQNLTSFHLKVLERSNLINSRKEGVRVFL